MRHWSLLNARPTAELRPIRKPGRASGESVEVLYRPALIAVQFLTCFPLRLKPPVVGREVGLSLLWYPFVGLLIGFLLWVAAVVLHALATPLVAAILVAAWALCTGALHLDGLADTADAWVGGHGDRARTLAIMKDPNSGPVAVATVVCILLIKFAALSSLRERGTPSWSDLHLACGYILPPALARAAVPVLFAQTAYVRAQGLGAELAKHQSRVGGCLVAAVTVLTTVTVWGWSAAWAIAASAAVYLVMQRGFVRRLGGMTGDCAGAMIEVTEAISVAVVASACTTSAFCA
jgi:adenosylcobinamide-GDP ribazoletransferase